MPEKVDRSSRAPGLELFTIMETALILNVSPKLVSRWIQSGALPALKLGPGKRLVRIRRAELEAFIESGLITEQPTPSAS